MAVRKTKSGLALKRWFKEKWKDEKGNVCGSTKNKKAERSKVVRAKKKVGMGRRRSSKSNVS